MTRRRRIGLVLLLAGLLLFFVGDWLYSGTGYLAPMPISVGVIVLAVSLMTLKPSSTP